MTPRYKDNPDLPLQVCKTITGDKEYRKNCKRKDGKWFPTNIEVVELNGKWYTIDSPKISFDHERKVYYVLELAQFSANIITNAVVGYNKETKKLIFGNFTKNKYNNIRILTDLREHYCINAEVLADSDYVEEIATGIWKKKFTGNVIKNILNHSNKSYNIEDVQYEQLLDLYNNKPYKFNISHAKIANLLKDTTFGIELEACEGNLPKHLLNRTGCGICKDGSLKNEQGLYPPEYVTVPMKGAKGISNIVELSEYLKSRNTLNIKCSYHLHLGNFNTSRLFLVALHSLCYKIQGGVFKMFPFYKLKPEGIKEGKNYCKVLPKTFRQYKNGEDFTEYIDASFKKLFMYLSEDGDHRRIKPCKTSNRKNRQHLGGQFKWNKVARYHWLNMINSIFSKRNTLEFRIHTPTFNATKIINWLLICNAICKYAEKYPLQCVDTTKISFDDILNYYQLKSNTGSFQSYVSDYLKAYVAERTELFKTDKKNGDLVSEKELLEDKNYTFIFNDKQLLQC